jgi:hypothetical protein
VRRSAAPAISKIMEISNGAARGAYEARRIPPTMTHARANVLSHAIGGSVRRGVVGGVGLALNVMPPWS